jgi:hypothetical protein
MVVCTSEQENLAGPGAGDDVRISVVIYVHNMRTESDASPARDAAVLFSFLEFHAGCQLRL